MTDPGQGKHASEDATPNRLITEKSPYLIQHAYNPVDWYPWGPEAFDQASRGDRPVFLSIGYSTCHWCHVMEKESFEDPRVARLMNETFISVKVDREERPDIDGIYMDVCQMMTGSGGWPLTVIMTPDRKPFFAGTYFPRETRHGRIGMIDLIPRVRKLWTEERPKIMKFSDEIVAQLSRPASPEVQEEPDPTVLDEAFSELRGRFDSENGGFGATPKFPAPHLLHFLLRHAQRTGSDEARGMVTKTLDAMRNGGIYDHAGFGFHRYATDAQWLVPHFEKMLYDQSMLCLAYTEAFQSTGEQRYRDTAEEIITYVLRDMTAPEGGFYSAEDADSEGEEGKFYVWRHDDIDRLPDPVDRRLIISCFGIRREGNFVDPVTGEQPGSNILHRTKSPEELAAESGLSVPEVESRIRSSLARLFAVRSSRPHPHKDDKILTDWNGLMISALAKASQAFGRQDYAVAAADAAAFILKNLRTPDGRLLHRYRDGEASLPAHIDDYAFFIAGLIELYEATFEPQYLADALALNELVMRHFEDSDAGGFFFTADDGEELLVRRKEAYDAAIPSGNSVALMNLLRLGRLTGDPGLEATAARAAKAFFPQVRQAPSAHAYFLCALDYSFGPAFEVVIAGDPEADDTRLMLTVLRTAFLPSVALLNRPDNASHIVQIAKFVKPYTRVNDRATAYVCRAYTCFPPTSDPATLLSLLQSDKAT